MANNEKAAAPTTNAVKKETNKKLGFGKRIAKWWREMKSELKKIIWPTPKQTCTNTIVALVMMLLSAVVIWGFDELAQMVVKAVITIAS